MKSALMYYEVYMSVLQPKSETKYSESCEDENFQAVKSAGNYTTQI